MCLPKFMAIHTLPEPMETEAITPLAKKVAANAEVFDKVPELPVDGIYPMAKLDSVDYRE